MDDKEQIEEVAHEYVQRHGPRSIEVLNDRAEMAEGIGDFETAGTWREIADAAERLVRSADLDRPA